MSQLFGFGLGYSAQTLAGRLAAKGWRIAGTVRDPVAIERLSGLGYAMTRFAGEADNQAVGQLLAGTTHLLLSIPPRSSGDHVLAQYRDVISALAQLQWIGYLSTVGVYGDSQGHWINETTQVAPKSERTDARVAAEAAWLDFGREIGRPVQVFRLAGIYGPGRSTFDKLRAGTARRIVKPGQVFNRIHVEDIATTLEASIARPRLGAIYNVADDCPAPPEDVVTYAAELIGLKPPPAVPFAEADLTPMARSFYEGNRRIANALIKSELGVTLAYPTYHEGLAAILRGEGAQAPSPLAGKP
jgi:nucleoside-diphosphate-sugar epimerase